MSDMFQPPFNRALLKAFVTLMPFMSALAPSEWTPLPLMLVFCIAPFILVASGVGLWREVLEKDFWFLATWILGCVAISSSPVGFGSKNLNYALALIVVYGSFLVMVRAWLHQPSLNWNVLGDAAQLSLTVLSIAIVVEFFTASFLGIFLSDLIPFAHDDLNVSNLVSESFKRPRGFAMEPGFSALAFECLWPLTFLSGKVRWWRQLTFVSAFCLLASAAALVSISVAVIIVWLVRRRDFWGLLKGGLIVVVLLLVFGMTETGTEVWQAAIGRKLDLSSAQEIGGDDAVTVLDRVTTYATGLTLAGESRFGIGWGTLGQAFSEGVSLPGVGTLSGSGMLSLYLDVVVAAGWTGLLCFIIFVFRRVVGVLRQVSATALYVSVALISVCFHHALITELQFPFLWFAIAVADKLIRGGGPDIRRVAYFLRSEHEIDSRQRSGARPIAVLRRE